MGSSLIGWVPLEDDWPELEVWLHDGESDDLVIVASMGFGENGPVFGSEEARFGKFE